MSTGTSDPLIGRLIDGRYQVRSRIARGGMATVYLATDLRLERRVAIKIMHGHLADDSQFKQRFIQEARSAARLAHPNVVNVFDQGQDAESAYLVMEYLPGITLRELMQDYGALTPEQTIDISEAVLSGLAAAHKAGIVHRDLKPENVLLADDGRIKIGDFGLARAAGANTATGAALLGTIAYLSPELVTRGVADTRSDIYAVGIMMYEMLTGEQPYKGEQPMQIAYQHANDTVPAPSAANAKVPAELDELVQWATARDPQERPGDARALLDQLHDTESLLQTALPATPTAAQRTMVLPAAPAMPPPSDAETMVLGGRAPASAPRSDTDEVSDSAVELGEKSRKRRRRRPLLLLLVLLLAALAAGAAWWFTPLGPGGQVPVPSGLQGQAVADADATLREAGFETAVDEAGEYSTEVEAGLVLRTDPGEGATAPRGSSVLIVPSLGPEEVAVPALAGGTLDDAREALGPLDIAIAEPVGEQYDEAERGTVLTASIEGADVSGGGTAFRGQTATLLVSAGPLPDVRGMTADAAIAALRQVGLTAAAGQNDYDEEVAVDRVRGLEQEGPFSPGDEVTLSVSRGPAPVPVPEVRGVVWTDAQALLQQSGFEIAFSNASSRILAATLPGYAYVTSVSPDQGAQAPRGSEVVVTLQAGGDD